MNDTAECPFCHLDSGRVFHREGSVVALWDAFPVARHHALVVPLRHVASWFDLTEVEHQEITRAIHATRSAIEQRAAPDGFNIGINIGAAAGQTVFHLVNLIREHLQDHLDSGGRVRFLTGDYMDLTDPMALRRLLDLEGHTTLRVFETGSTTFHPKAYIFRGPGRSGAAYIGSSNLTDPALLAGVEWNYRVDRETNAAGFQAALDAFETLFADSHTRPLRSR